MAMLYTEKGYIDEELLVCKPIWIVNEDHIQFIEEHWFEGECVKRAVHVHLLKMPEGMDALAGKLAEAAHG